MRKYAALDVSMEQTAICVVDESGKKIIEGKVQTDPDTVTTWLENAGSLEKVGMETGPLAVWLWNELRIRGLPIVCLDARHASTALAMMPNKTDRHDAAGLAADGSEVVLRIEPHGSGDSPLDVAVLIDHSGSAVRGLEAIAKGLRSTDGIDLWEFDTQLAHIGSTT